MAAKKPLKFKQIIAAPWEGSYSIYGLTNDGKVYMLLRSDQNYRWRPIPTTTNDEY